MFLLSSGNLCSTRQAGRHYFKIEDGLKSLSVKCMRQLSGPTAKSAVIYCFYPFLFVISAGFIIRFFGLGIAVEKWYQMCLINFKSSFIDIEIGAYPLLLSKW